MFWRQILQRDGCSLHGKMISISRLICPIDDLHFRWIETAKPERNENFLCTPGTQDSSKCIVLAAGIKHHIAYFSHIVLTHTILGWCIGKTPAGVCQDTARCIGKQNSQVFSISRSHVLLRSLSIIPGVGIGTVRLGTKKKVTLDDCKNSVSRRLLGVQRPQTHIYGVSILYAAHLLSTYVPL